MSMSFTLRAKKRTASIMRAACLGLVAAAMPAKAQNVKDEFLWTDAEARAKYQKLTCGDPIKVEIPTFGVQEFDRFDRPIKNWRLTTIVIPLANADAKRRTTALVRNYFGQFKSESVIGANEPAIVAFRQLCLRYPVPTPRQAAAAIAALRVHVGPLAHRYMYEIKGKRRDTPGIGLGPDLTDPAALN